MPLASSNFLIPNGTFVVVLIAFLLVVGFIGWYVVPRLNKLLTERQNQIRGDLEAADRAKSDAEAADRKRRETLDKASAEAREIVALATTTAEQMVSSAEARAQEVYDRIVASADAEVAVARQAAVDEVTNRVGEIVMAAAERVVGREIRADDHRDLIDEAIAAVREVGTPTAGTASGAAR